MALTSVKKDQTRKRETRETPSIQSLDRGLLILEAVERSRDPVTLTQLAAMLGIDRSSAFRLANTLKRRGFLANPSAGRDYVLGRLGLTEGAVDSSCRPRGSNI
jgi:IclR family acetate operon transcriptional repressor